MLTKASLKKSFEKDWKKHYQLELFRERGFLRKKCPSCGKNFWTLDSGRKVCGDPPCENYGFIGKTITKSKWDYIETWKKFEKFFRKNGHASVPRYPVIDRWRPDLFFTVASIQDFQRLDGKNVVFEYPANPLVVPQVCLRFNDIPNVGVTGRHHTSFIMSGQHAFGFPRGGYFKDRCIELNFNFLSKVMGIPEEELTYVEDVWAMPDFSAFGPSMETFSRGLELVNSVFMQFTRTGSSYRELPIKVIDVGWGHERLVWFSHGTHTGYEAVFGPVIRKLQKGAGLKDSDLFNRYSVIAGGLDMDEVADIRKARQGIAGRLGVTVKELNETVEPMQALYAIADHMNTLLFAVSDGGIPSNVGGGYNLRVLLRRALSFLSEFGFGFTLDKVSELHAARLKPLFPELREGLEPLSRVLAVESERYRNTMQKAGLLVERELKGGGLTTKDMVKLYTSNGITPEMIEKAAASGGHTFSVPEDFYAELTSLHMAGRKEEDEEELRVDVSGMPETRKLYYEDCYRMMFRAKILRASGNWIVLDRTAFYPEGGGQPSDRGTLKIGRKECRVTDVRKVGGVILHRTEKRPALRQGQEVRGEIDWDRRYQLMKMHTCTHLLAGAARKVIGRHVWQAGAQKGLETSRIDLTHYQAFTEEEAGRIGKLVNETIRKNLAVESAELPRSEAEGRYGFVLYQGGASPGKRVRIVRVGGGFDVEACGGTHLKRTGEIGRMKIIRTERIQDGVNRIEFTCGKAAEEFEKSQAQEYRSLLRGLGSAKAFQGFRVSEDREPTKDMSASSDIFSIEPAALPQTLARFGKEILKDREEINALREELGRPPLPGLERKDFPNLSAFSGHVFGLWKSQRKELDSLRREFASREAGNLLARARKNHLFEVVSADRKGMIEMANSLLARNSRLTIILANQAGDIIGMSRTEDMGRLISAISRKAGGSGGGRKDFAQGRVELSKLLKVIKEFSGK
jgi:alanyl-tRNA synthetase